MSDFIDETTVIEVEEEPISTIALTTNNHALLENRYSPNQHNIASIEGLADKLEKIEAPKNLQTSKGKSYAEYWSWSDKNISQDDRTGYFVSLIQDNDNNTCIEIINEANYNVFGVTTNRDTVAFIGNEEWEAIVDEETQTIAGYESTRDSSYGLVCLAGNVKVRYLTNADKIDINPGDFIKPGTDGYAIKAENNDGYYRVINTGVDFYGNYVVINLSLSASDAENISVKHAKTADDYTDSGTIKQDLDKLDQKIDSEILNTENDIKNGVIIASVAKNFDTTDGSIKEEFDKVNKALTDEITKIEDGTTIAAHSGVADSINVENIDDKKVKPYSIKTCTTEALENIEDQSSDAMYMLTDDTTIEDLEKDVGYLNAWKEQMTPPEDKPSWWVNKAVWAEEAYTYPFINVADYDDNEYYNNLDNYQNTMRFYFPEGRTYSNMPGNCINGWLEVFASSNNGEVVDQMFYRHGSVSTDSVGAYAGGTYFEIYTRSRLKPAGSDDFVWTEWTRLMTEKDVVEESFHAGTADSATNATNATNAINDSDGKKISTTYAKLSDSISGYKTFSIGTIVTVSNKSGNLLQILKKIQIKYTQSETYNYFYYNTTKLNETDIEVDGTWLVLGMCNTDIYLIQRIS